MVAADYLPKPCVFWLGMGSQSAPDHQWRVCKPGCAVRTVAADLRHWLCDDFDAADTAAAPSGSGIFCSNYFMRLP